MQLLVLTSDAAEAVRGPYLQPRQIAAGAYAGRYALNPAVLDDPEHFDHHDRLLACPVEDIDPATAWPPTEE